MHTPLFKKFFRNPAGRDFVVGDIHGCFGDFEFGLSKINFNPSRDRIFSVGDLIDRGPQPERFEEFISRPWFFAIRGNHEQMLIDSVTSMKWEIDWENNGGIWASEFEEHQVERWAVLLDALPLAMEVETASGAVGIIHAGLGNMSWEQARHRIKSMEDQIDSVQNASYSHDEKLMASILWSRRMAKKLIAAASDKRPVHGYAEQLDGLSSLVIGHTASKAPVFTSNIWLIDTGAGYKGGSLTFLCLDDLTTTTVPTKSGFPGGVSGCQKG